MRYQCNPKTTVRAKVDSAGHVTACAVNKCCDKVSVTVTAAVRKNVRLAFGSSRLLFPLFFV